VSTVLQRPHSLNAQSARPLERCGEPVVTGLDGLVAEQLRGFSGNSGDRVRTLVHVGTTAPTTSPQLGKVVLRRRFCSGASRTRTGDLPGAMRECDCAWEAAFSALESGTVARRIPPRRGTDSRGLPGITFDLGTKSGLVPIHLWPAAQQLVPAAAIRAKRQPADAQPRPAGTERRCSSGADAAGVGRQTLRAAPRIERLSSTDGTDRA
jgi:hypothetical protein